MSPYVIVDAASSRNLDPGENTNVEVMIYAGTVLPVFNSRESLSEFARAQHPAEDPIRPTPLEVDALMLARMAGEIAGVKLLVFDPVIDPSGAWDIQDDPWPVSSYCRYMVELARGTKRLFAEGRAMFSKECSSPEKLNELVSVWVALQADKVDADAKARVQEWEVKDDSRDEGLDLPA